MQEKILEKYREVYGAEAEVTAFSPGRVNLIGEHTDYNAGHVFPCALTLGTYGALRKRKDRLLRFYSVNFEQDGILTVDLKQLHPQRTTAWTAYPEGIFWAMEQAGCPFDGGADLLFWGTIPEGSGLSSSASMEILTALLLRQVYGFTQFSNVELAQLCQFSENHYNGMQCGIMDQFSCAMGKKDHAIFLDTHSLSYRLVPLVLGDAGLVITNSRVKHSLVASAYNDRRRECGKALQAFQKIEACKDLNGLCELTVAQFEQYSSALADETLRKRARHAVYENARTLAAVQALTQNDIKEFGRLMNESHLSLQEDYEVSCEEIDFLAHLAWDIDGVLGSRLTGGGFGGCTVSIVKKDRVEAFQAILQEKYKERFGLLPAFYVASPADGAHLLSD